MSFIVLPFDSTMWLYLLFLLFTASVIAGSVQSKSFLKPESKRSQCPANWTYNMELQQCYFISDNFSSFSDAENYCSDVAQGELVSIYTEYEYNIVSEVIEQQTYDEIIPAWIGLQTYAFDPFYRWQDKSAANYTKFINGTAPANVTEDSCFGWVKAKGNDGWVLADCETLLPFICKRHVAHGNDVFVNGTSGTITSPKYPIPYEPAVTSYYYISVPLGNVIDLTFKFLAIDSDSLIQVYDGWTDGSSVLETITSTYRSNMIESTSNQVMVQFVASGSSGGRYFGWSASYNAIIPITLTGGLTSSNYPSNAANNEYLQQDIRVPENFGILFTVWDFQSYGSAALEISTVWSDGRFDFLNLTTDYQTNTPYRLKNTNARVAWTTTDSGDTRRLNITWAADP